MSREQGIYFRGATLEQHEAGGWMFRVHVAGDKALASMLLQKLPQILAVWLRDYGPFCPACLELRGLVELEKTRQGFRCTHGHTPEDGIGGPGPGVPRLCPACEASLPSLFQPSGSWGASEATVSPTPEEQAGGGALP